jgi:hypothetical protein
VWVFDREKRKGPLRVYAVLWGIRLSVVLVLLVALWYWGVI